MKQRRSVEAGLLAILLLVTGCCLAPPVGTRYFDRSTPRSTIKLIQYSIETGDISTAYASTTPSSQKLMNETQFRFYLWFGSIPGWEVGVRDFIVEAEHWYWLDNQSRDKCIATLACDGDGDWSPEFVQQVELLKAGDEWLLDLTRIKGVTH